MQTPTGHRHRRRASARAHLAGCSLRVVHLMTAMLECRNSLHAALVSCGLCVTYADRMTCAVPCDVPRSFGHRHNGSPCIRPFVCIHALALASSSLCTRVCVHVCVYVRASVCVCLQTFASRVHAPPRRERGARVTVASLVRLYCFPRHARRTSVHSFTRVLAHASSRRCTQIFRTSTRPCARTRFLASRCLAVAVMTFNIPKSQNTATQSADTIFVEPLSASPCLHVL